MRKRLLLFIQLIEEWMLPYPGRMPHPSTMTKMNASFETETLRATAIARRENFSLEQHSLLVDDRRTYDYAEEDSMGFTAPKPRET